MNSNSRPLLLIDEKKCRRNIKSMCDKAANSNVEFRPHFKTHQSHAVGEWYQEEGVRCITVSSFDMAKYFSGLYDDITLAIPFNITQLEELNILLTSQKITLLVDSEETVRALDVGLKGPVECWIEIDTGSKRTGIEPHNIAGIEEVLTAIKSSSHLDLKGFYSHPGHTYHSRDIETVRKVYEKALKDMMMIRDHFSSYQPFAINIGDTPGCTAASSFDTLDSISPGNFVFYDLTQVAIGSSTEDEIGVCLSSPIIGKNRERLEFALYGGGIHLSKERLDENGTTLFGKMVELTAGGWSKSVDGCYLRAISQEHGILKVTQEIFDNYRIGDRVGILPIHSCMTADCMGGYQTMNGIEIDHMRKFR